MKYFIGEKYELYKFLQNISGKKEKHIEGANS